MSMFRQQWLSSSLSPETKKMKVHVMMYIYIYEVFTIDIFGRRQDHSLVVMIPDRDARYPSSIRGSAENLSQAYLIRIHLSDETLSR